MTEEKLNKWVKTLEKFMHNPVPDDIHSQIEHLQQAISLFALQGIIMEAATLVHQEGKGDVLKSYMDGLDNGSYGDMKAHEFRMWTDGKMAGYEALFHRAERTVKAFDKYIDGLRTIISANKSEKMQTT